MLSNFEPAIELRHVRYTVPARDEYQAETTEEDEFEEAEADENVEVAADGAELRRVILDDLSFQVPPRSITCIMGISGSGKTTLLRLIAGLTKPDSGEILVRGQDIVPLSEKELNDVRRDLGFVFQYGALFDSLTVAENVAFGLHQMRRPQREIRDIVEQRLRDVGLPGIEDRLPAALSGGMRKRVAIARALATKPNLVLYDEPTSGLDPVMARVLDDLIVKLRDETGATNVVVSHHLPSILRIADHVLMLHKARIEAQGTPQEIQASRSPVVRQFLEGQAHGPITVL